MNTNLYKSTETSITKNGVEMTLSEAVSELQELSRVSYRLECDKINLTETAKQLEKENTRLKAKTNSLSGLCLRMMDAWWCFVHAALFASNTATDLHREASDWLSQNSKECLAEHDAEVINRAIPIKLSRDQAESLCELICCSNECHRDCDCNPDIQKAWVKLREQLHQKAQGAA
jgi:predicted nuclease with TOPRIM domain